MKKIIYLGPENTYSFIAAQSIAKTDDILVAAGSFGDVLDGVRDKHADIAVVPMENSVEGSVNEVTDNLISGGSPVYINAEFVLKIENYLISQKDALHEKIGTILTHWQPYAQCRQTLKLLLPNAKIVFADSTASAVASISNKTTAAIGGKQLLSEKYRLSENSINDNRENSTRFAVLSCEDSIKPENDKMTIVFEAENKPGGLLRFLEILNVFGMNMTHIESRPHKSVLGRYLFIADITGNILDDNTLSALKLIKRNTVFYKYLGSYKGNL